MAGPSGPALFKDKDMERTVKAKNLCQGGGASQYVLEGLDKAALYIALAAAYCFTLVTIVDLVR